MAVSRSSPAAGFVRELEMRLGRHLLLALAALPCACDSQADSSYLGEPLITLPGYVASAGAAGSCFPQAASIASITQRLRTRID